MSSITLDTLKRIVMEVASTLQEVHESEDLTGDEWQEIADELQRASDRAQEEANDAEIDWQGDDEEDDDE